MAETELNLVDPRALRCGRQAGAKTAIKRGNPPPHRPYHMYRPPTPPTHPSTISTLSPCVRESSIEMAGGRAKISFASKHET